MCNIFHFAERLLVVYHTQKHHLMRKCLYQLLRFDVVMHSFQPTVNLDLLNRMSGLQMGFLRPWLVAWRAQCNMNHPQVQSGDLHYYYNNN